MKRDTCTGHLAPSYPSTRRSASVEEAEHDLLRMRGALDNDRHKLPMAVKADLPLYIVLL